MKTSINRSNLVIAFTVCPVALAAFADQTNYQSPIDGKIYQGDWRTYFQTNSPATNAPASRVHQQGVRLLSTQDAFSRSIEVKELADFIRKTEQAVESALGATNDAFKLAVQTTLSKKKKPQFEMASKGNVSDAVLQEIYNCLGKLPDCRSRKDDLKYEVRFAISKKP